MVIFRVTVLLNYLVFVIRFSLTKYGWKWRENPGSVFVIGIIEQEDLSRNYFETVTKILYHCTDTYSRPHPLIGLIFFNTVQEERNGIFTWLSYAYWKRKVIRPFVLQLLCPCLYNILVCFMSRKTYVLVTMVTVALEVLFEVVTVNIFCNGWFSNKLKAGR